MNIAVGSLGTREAKSSFIAWSESVLYSLYLGKGPANMSIFFYWIDGMHWIFVTKVVEKLLSQTQTTLTWF